MQFSIEKSIEILERTPNVINSLLTGLSDEWIVGNEGENTWNLYDIVGHLVHAEKINWIPRMDLILSDSTNKAFFSFDRFAQFENSKGKTLSQLISEFKTIREENIEILESKKLTDANLLKTAIHPQLGEVTLKQLLATWTAHDMTHLAQIARVIAKQYKEEVGPWIVN